MPKLFDIVMDPATARTIQEPFGEHLVYFDGPTNEVSVMTAGSVRLNPGATPHPPHQHPEEEILFITEGSGEVTIGEKSYKVSAGSAMYCEANKLHGITNTGSRPLLFYFCKWKA